ncbi:MAG: hypothetical protein WDA21_05740 [Bacilli bacterium]
MEGLLKRNAKNDYYISKKGYNENISEQLNLLLLDKVRIYFHDCNNKKYYFKGNLIRKKKPPSEKEYNYYIKNKNLDELFNKNINNNIKIKIIPFVCNGDDNINDL